MLRTLLIDDDGQITYGGKEQLDSWQQDKKGLLWLDVCAPDGVDEETLLLELGCHQLAIKDTLRDRHPPKVELFHDYLFILYRGIADIDDELSLQHLQIGMFIGHKILITRHDKPSFAIDSLFNEAGATHLAKSTSNLALRIFHTSCGRYLQTLFEFENKLAQFEESFTKNANDELMRTLTLYRSKLVKLKRVFNYHVAIAAELKLYVEDNETDLINPPDLHTAIDLYERCERLLSLSQMYYDICGDLVDGYISITSHQLNNTMQVLTVITAIFVPLGLLAGIYGMNFEYIPELKIEYGYFYLLGIMAFVAISLVVFFRKRRWL